MPENRKKNNRIIIFICCLFVIVAISGLFIIDAVINRDVESRNDATDTTSSVQKETEISDIKEETKKETSTSFEETSAEIETTTTEETTFEDLDNMNEVGNDILENVVPVNSTFTKKMGEEQYYFKTYIQNNTSYTLTSITLSYQVSESDYTYIMYQEILEPGQTTPELSCIAISGSETYPLYSEEISFIGEDGMEHFLSYDAVTGNFECY